MDPQRLLKAEALYRQAGALAAGARAAFLDHHCGGDSELRREVEFLFRQQASEPETGTAMKPALPGAAVRVDVGAASESSEPDHIGPYKLLQQIGQGGFGVVYLAEQEQPVQRRVALKVIKLGMDTKQVIARFEAERQALAMMNHPNVARVFDGGATPAGRPYFVMEYVQGIPITDYCDRHKLTTQERLKLFIAVCEAVHHAHQKGIIHRDIKPSNVLVAVIDDKPAPKVIDFGVAKATNQHLTEQTVYTEQGQLIGTPEYMSPEQAEMSQLDIDTRTDVYSLGVLLYELLTGTLPFDAFTLRRGGFAEIQRIIREVEPAKPSTRLSALEKEESGSAGPMVITAAEMHPLAGRRTSILLAAEKRRTDPHSLIRLLRGDLDWIVMKCLEKDRTRRYESAAALASDFERYLHQLPILARPPSMLYRTRKLLRRRRAAVAVTVIAVIAAAAGTIAVVNRRSAMRAARTAIEQRSNDLAQHAGLRIHAGEMAEAEAAIREALALNPQNINALLNLATIKRREYDASRKQQAADEAMACLDRVIALQPKRAESYNIKGVYLRGFGRLDEAIEQHRMCAQLAPEYAPNWISLANALVLKGDLAQAEQCLKDATQLPATHGDDRPWQRWHNLAALQLARDDPSATEALDRAIALGAGVPEVWLLKAKLSLLLKAAFDPEQAENAARTAENLMKPSPAPARMYRLLALARLRRGDFKGAQSAADRAVALKDSLPVYPGLIAAAALAGEGQSSAAAARREDALKAWPAELEQRPMGIEGSVENGVLWFETVRELTALRGGA